MKIIHNMVYTDLNKVFGATFTEFIGEIYMPFKPIKYKMYRFSEKAFRTIRQIKRKMSNN